MDEQEALIRAREAGAQRYPHVADDYRSGKNDLGSEVQIATRALLDLDKPLPVDPDLADLREVFAAFCDEAGSSGGEGYRAGYRDGDLKGALSTFRAIIQRRIEEAVKDADALNECGPR